MSESIGLFNLTQVVVGKLKEIAHNTKSSACCAAITSAGTADVPAGFGSVSIVLLSGTADVTMSDGSTYPMTTVGEVLIQAAPGNKFLPAITITGSGTWKWSAIK